MVVGLVRALGSLLVVGALAGSGYAAYELYDAQQVRHELEGLRAEVRDLRDRQVGLRAGSVAPVDLDRLTQLVRQLDGELTDVRAHLAELERSSGELELLRDDLDRLARSTAVLSSCLEGGLSVDDEGRAYCDP